MLLDDSEIRNKKLEADYLRTFGQTLAFALSEEINDGLGDVYSEDDNGNLSIDRTNIRLTADGPSKLERVMVQDLVDPRNYVQGTFKDTESILEGRKQRI